MEPPPSRQDQELWPPAQAAVLLALWAVWASMAAFAVCREHRLNARDLYYDRPALVYGLLRFWIPLPLVWAGAAHLRRALPKCRAGWAAYLVVAGLTLAGGAVVLTGVVAGLTVAQMVRE